ncbi:MAG: hypothetical protein ACYSTL_07850, partial [Planctomycetota bacterium]
AGLADLARKLRVKLTGGVTIGVLLLIAAVHSAAGVLDREYLISEDPHMLVDAESICRDAAPLWNGKTAIVSLPTRAELAYYYTVQFQGNELVSPIAPQTLRVLIVVGDHQTPAEVCDAHPALQERFGTPQLWGKYTRASVYLARRAGFEQKIRDKGGEYIDGGMRP